MYKKHILDTIPYKVGATKAESKNKNENQKIYKLSSNENFLGPSPKALEAIQESLNELSEYHHRDDSVLKKALVDHYDNGIEANQYITANSGVEIIDIICRGFLDADSEVIVSSPTFKAYGNFAAIENATVIDVPLKTPDFSLNVEGIIDAINENTRLIFLTTPNNPTGTIVSKKDVDYLLDNIPDTVIVVYDEVYFHFVEDPDFCNAAYYIKKNENVIAIHSFSKAYGLAGMRIGYAFSTPKIASYLQKIGRPFMINVLSTAAAVGALTDDEHIENTQKLISEQKKWMYTQFEELGITYWKSEANFILFKSPIAEEKITSSFLKAGIMVRPCSKFGVKDHIRVTVATPVVNTMFFEVLKTLLSI